jgi:polyphosphate glucokinase
MEVGGMEGEQRASARVRTEEHLDWAQWSERVNVYLDAINRLFWPELIVIGGGISRDFAEFGARLRSRATVVPAKLGPAAGVVGAAMAVASINS